MNLLVEAALDIERFCRQQNWRFCIIGGLAVQRWGEPRQTRDVVLTVLAPLGAEEDHIEPLIAQYRPRIDDAREFALQHRVVLVETASGIPLDISLGALPYEARVIERGSAFELGSSQSVTTCSPEDLVVLKAFAGRPQDWLDIEGIIARQSAGLDRSLVLVELRSLLELKDDVSAASTLEALFNKHS